MKKIKFTIGLQLFKIVKSKNKLCLFAAEKFAYPYNEQEYTGKYYNTNIKRDSIAELKEIAKGI